jgi:L-alanine-DL-glutamate epimerase-like enolase superfamily enzyme
LLKLLPAGGARNALDCALWDLRAKQSGRPVWQLAGLAPPRPVMTAHTIGLACEADFRRKAREASGYPLLKLKVDADRHLDLVRMAREIHPSARILVDANQSWSRSLLERLLPPLAELGVELVEQPVRRDQDALLDGLRSPLPLAADESCTDRDSLPGLVGRYQYINIKLDKCGGLTEALAMCGEARQLGFGLMVGNMCGTSLAMAPAFLVAQSCEFTDLDGPLLRKLDRRSPIRFQSGWMQPPEPGALGMRTRRAKLRACAHFQHLRTSHRFSFQRHQCLVGVLKRVNADLGRIGISAASGRNSAMSRRVMFATDLISRSIHRCL